MVWNPLDSPVDRVSLGGQYTPGIAEITGWTSPRKWDARKGFALAGAITVFCGVDLASGMLKLRFYTQEHWEEWAAFRPLVQRPPVGSRGKALEIRHPLLDGIDVKAVVVQDVSQPEQEDDGVWCVTIKLLEWRRPKVQLQKPEASKEKPVDPVDRRIEEMTSQVNELADG